VKRETRLAWLLLGFAFDVSRPGPSLAAEASPPVQVSAHADKAEVTVGEAFSVELEATGPAGTTYSFPPLAQTDGAEMVSTPSGPSAASPSGPASEGPLPPNRRRYEARVFALGEATLPALVVKYRLADGTQGEASAPALTVKVGTLLPKGEEQAPIADIRPPVSVGIAPEFWAAIGLGLLLLGAMAFALWRRLRRPALPGAEAAVPALGPEAEARGALAALVRADHFGRGDARGYYIALTAIAKRYLERRLGAPVLEMTTAEMLAFLREAKDGEPLLGVMRDVALAADQVKFAKGDALREEGERHLQSVEKLVTDLEVRLRPVPAAAGPTEGKAA